MTMLMCYMISLTQSDDKSWKENERKAFFLFEGWTEAYSSYYSELEKQHKYMTSAQLNVRLIHPAEINRGEREGTFYLVFGSQKD